MNDIPLTTRLAPSPTGEIHAGTIFAALQSWLLAKSTGGEVVLRIEDLDRERSKPEFADQIMREYEALGITWDRGPYYQKDRTDAYEVAFEKLVESDLVYPCFCTRADLRSMSAPHLGEETVYDGRCASLNESEVLYRKSSLELDGRNPSMRVKLPDTSVAFTDMYQGICEYSLRRDCGDFIVRRSDGGYAYQLAVVVDDHAQGINCVSRGYDLLASTPKQMFLYEVFGWEMPYYAHFPLFCASDGRRLSKRDEDATLEMMIDDHGDPKGVLGHIAYLGGLADEDAPTTPDKLLSGFSIDSMKDLYECRRAIYFT